MSIKNYLSDALKPFEIELTDKMYSAFEAYYNLLIEWNEKMNLTRITHEEEVAVKHFADSLSLLTYAEIDKNAKVIDVGTGAGFPGIPLKIARNDIRLTLLDSLNKRINFLSEVCSNIGIKAETVHLRAEEGGRSHKFREKYDVAVSRAVARLDVLSEYCLPYVKVGGCFVAMKGPDAENEIREAEGAIEKLGGCVESINEFNLSDNSGRTIVIIRKEEPTPKVYPRQGTKIKNKPIK